MQEKRKATFYSKAQELLSCLIVKFVLVQQLKVKMESEPSVVKSEPSVVTEDLNAVIKKNQVGVAKQNVMVQDKNNESMNTLV